jgi:hypothetical protein
MTVIPMLGKLRKVDCLFKVRMDYMRQPCLRKESVGMIFMMERKEITLLYP